LFLQRRRTRIAGCELAVLHSRGVVVTEYTTGWVEIKHSNAVFYWYFRQIWTEFSLGLSLLLLLLQLGICGFIKICQDVQVTWNV